MKIAVEREWWGLKETVLEALDNLIGFSCEIGIPWSDVTVKLLGNKMMLALDTGDRCFIFRLRIVPFSLYVSFP